MALAEMKENLWSAKIYQETLIEEDHAYPEVVLPPDSDELRYLKVGTLNHELYSQINKNVATALLSSKD